MFGKLFRRRQRTWPGVPACPLAAKYPQAELAVRVLEARQTGAMWDTVWVGLDEKRGSNDPVRLAVNILKDVADVAIAYNQDTPLTDARPQMDTEAFYQYVKERLFGSPYWQTPVVPDGTDTR